MIPPIQILVAGDDFDVVECDRCSKKVQKVARVVDVVVAGEDQEVGIQYDLCYKCLKVAIAGCRVNFLTKVLTWFRKPQ